MSFHRAEHDCVRRKRASSGFSIWGLLGLLAAMFLLIIVLLPTVGTHSRKAPRVVCTTQLKQIALAMHLWLEDHKTTNFPMQVSFTNGGSKELTLRGLVTPTFWAISNELRNPQVATCPADKERLPGAKSFNSMTDGNISYFLNSRDATWSLENQNEVLLGDRNIATNGVSLPSGIAQIHDPQTVSWTIAIHERGGNVALVDGSVRQTTSKSLGDHLKTTIVTNTLIIP